MCISQSSPALRPYGRKRLQNHPKTLTELVPYKMGLNITEDISSENIN